MPLFGTGGKPIGVFSTWFRNSHRPTEQALQLSELYSRQAADVVASRLSEQRSREAETQFRLALDAAQMGTWAWDAAANVLTANSVHQGFFGLPPQDGPLPVQIYWDRMVQEEIDQGFEKAKWALKKGNAFQMEQRVIGQGGKHRWLLSRGRAQDDDPDRMLGVSLDITDRKRMEETLRQSEARLQAAVDLLGLGLYAWDPQTNALSWDTRVRAMWGLSADEPVDFGLFMAGVHPDDRDRVQGAISSSTDPQGDGVCKVEYRVLGRDGVERWVATPRPDDFPTRPASGIPWSCAGHHQTQECGGAAP